MKKVIIVGAGISGLSAGIYALQSGFDVTIIEQHTIPGGNCTSWKRKGYLFEGAIHWLTGSSPATQLFKIWKNIGAIDENTPMHQADIIASCIMGNESYYLYSDPQKLKSHFLDISPSDSQAILSLYRDITQFRGLEMMITDIKGLKVKEKATLSFSLLFKILKNILRIKALTTLSCQEYIHQFKHEGLRHLLSSVIGDDYNAASLLFTLSTRSSGDGGYPEGGSLAMTTRIAKRYETLGGKIIYCAKVKKIMTEEGKATGVQYNETTVTADAIVVTVDTLSAIDTLFEKPLTEPWMNRMRQNTALAVCTFISLGVESDLKAYPKRIVLPLKVPIHFAGKEMNILCINNYAAFKNYAPKGCTALTIALNGDTYDYWNNAKKEGTYDDCKMDILNQIINRIEDALPQTKNKFTVTDVATPLTYERYCGTYHGSWMTITKKNNLSTHYPCKSETIDNLYFAGQRIKPPGGFPGAVDTGRIAAQYLCKDAKVVFQGRM